ncbi:unnamed protein product [Ixodes persulcatus]
MHILLILFNLQVMAIFVMAVHASWAGSFCSEEGKSGGLLSRACARLVFWASGHSTCASADAWSTPGNPCGLHLDASPPGTAVDRLSGQVQAPMS